MGQTVASILAVTLGTGVLERMPAHSQDAARPQGTITAVQRTKFVPPVYPKIAAAARVQGDVVLDVTITASGKVERAVVRRSIPLLDQAAIDAVMQWEYTPARLNGVPVPIVMTATVSFSLSDSPVAESPAADTAPVQWFGIPQNLMPTGPAVPYVRLANTHLMAGRYVEAAEALTSATKAEPGNAACWFMLGGIQSHNRNPQRNIALAAASMRRAIALGVPADSFMSRTAQTVLAEPGAAAASGDANAPGSTAPPAGDASSGRPRTPDQAAGNAEPADLRGTAWRCQGRQPEFTWTGYMYLAPSSGVVVWETSRSPRDVGGVIWPSRETDNRVPTEADLASVQPRSMIWATTRQGVTGPSRVLRIYYHFLSAMYVFRMQDGQLHGGLVSVSEHDPETYQRYNICQGNYPGRSGACPDLFDYRIPPAAVRETIVCEPRPGWLR
jgi:TonB family protein